jgi:hypothetical protein
MTFGKWLWLGLVACSTSIGLLAFVSRAQEPGTAEYEKCRRDLRCWGELNLSKANYTCQAAVERTLTGKWRWTNGTLFRFSHYRWDDEEKSIVAYLGDRLQVQDASGVFQQRRYVCDYDPIMGTVGAVGLLDR